MIDWILFTISIFVVTLLIQQWNKKWARYPPGPFGLPLIGHLIQLGPTPHKTLMNWKQKYGKVVAVNFGSFPTVAVSDYKLIRTLLNDPAFSGRPDIESFKYRSGGIRHGILFADGSEWQEQRRFIIKQLKEFGFGKKSMENILHNEILEVIENISSTSLGIPIKFKSKIVVAVINSLWIFMIGERFEHNNLVLHEILNAIQTNLEKFNGLSALAMFMPWFTKTFPILSGFNEMNKDLSSMKQFLNGPILKHKDSIVYGHSRDLIDAYLNEIQNCENPMSSFHKNHAETVLMTVCLDLFTAGAETTTTALGWLFLYLALNPTIQSKIHEELDNVVGRSRLVCLNDKINLPYTEAVIQETLRYSTITPTGLFKNTLEDVELAGYLIPKNTMIVTNLYDCHFDKDYWGDPEIFRPERFLQTNPETQKLCLIKHEPFLAFLAGKRSCLGEELARAELFIFSSNLLQRFSVDIDKSKPIPSIEPIVSTVAIPKPHYLVFENRK